MSSSSSSALSGFLSFLSTPLGRSLLFGASLASLYYLYRRFHPSFDPDSSDLFSSSSSASAAGAASVLASSGASPRSLDREAQHSQPALTPLSEAQVRKILAYYIDHSVADSDREHLVNYRELRGGLSNSNYAVETNKRKLLLKIHDEKPYESIRCQLKALNYLRLSRLPIAYPILPNEILQYARNPEVTRIDPGTLILQLDQLNPIVCFDFIEGKMPSQATPNVMKQLGNAMARLHTVPVEPFKRFLGEFPMGISEMKPFLEKELIQAPIPVQNDPFIAYLRSELAILEPKITNPALPQSVLHGDLFLENTIFSVNAAGQVDEQSRLAALIDFEEMCVGPTILDIAMTLVGCAFDDKNQLNFPITEAFLREYVNVHPLTSLERDSLPLFLVYCLLSIAFWRFRQFHVRTPKPEKQAAHLVMLERRKLLDLKKFKKLCKSLQ